MPLYLHTFQGKCAAGDVFSYGWHANSIRDIDNAHGAALVWNLTLWNGAVAAHGYKDHCTADVSMLNVRTVQLNIATGKQLLLRETAQIIAGVAAGNSMSADNAITVSMYSELPQRRGRGRFALPQPAASSLTALGRVAAATVNDIHDSLVAAWAGYNTGVDKPCIYGPADRTPRNVIRWNIPDLMSTQRRRENKVPAVRVAALMP